MRMTTKCEMSNQAPLTLKIGRAKRNRPDERIQENANKIFDARKFSFIKTKTVEDAIKLETNLIKDRKPPLNKEKKGK